MQKFIRNGIIVELILIMILLLHYYKKSTIEPNSVYTMNIIQKWQDYPITDIALINTYLDDIQTATSAYYSNILNSPPDVEWYYVKVINITPVDINSISPSILITFECLPYIAAHVTVGRDQITFQTEFSGRTFLREYNHLETYELPEHLHNYLK